MLNRGFTVKFFRVGTVGDHQQFRDVSKFGTNDKFFMDLACETERQNDFRGDKPFVLMLVNQIKG